MYAHDTYSMVTASPIALVGGGYCVNIQSLKKAIQAVPLSGLLLRHFYISANNNKNQKIQ